MMNKSDFVQKIKTEKISAGIISSDWLCFEENLSLLKQFNINLLHFDIADGSFSSLFTVGPMAVSKFPSSCFKDVHLLTNNQYEIELITQCIKSGANVITLQLEASGNILKSLQWLSQQYLPEQQVLSGLSLCPETPLEKLQDYLQYVDVIQLLTFDPRTGDKASIDYTVERIKQLHKLLSDERERKIISIDGSMTLDMAKVFCQYDIDWIVSGSALFGGANLSQTLTHWSEIP
ncbi:ribulose phosphate epimerase [Pasteurellaceae bacterium HPA106]|uniref:ribulose phosphate epimerase n=1 Tax=Spirabiliibacterium pneumoniae TaxID=221400 RepID=UPI001AAD2DFA|nr:ribulose phosphate epimerase [Spirabiliibacterium pneumoniae]MBE2896422.1 ribulose phosphate epimerase [Spirabiliibacterium pneumoniae]